jgi:predicted nucleic acid-binding protein
VKVFLDSNIPMYVAGQAHANREPARRMLELVRSGQVEGCTSTEVLQEILYRYTALERRDLARDVYDLFVQICPIVFDVTLADTDRARDLLVARAGLSARDAVHAAVMTNRGVEWIATFDRGFDGIPGIRRIELA